MRVERLLVIAILLGFVALAGVLFVAVFFETPPQPISMAMYRGAAAVGIFIGMLVCFIALLGKLIWEHVITDRALQKVVNIPEPNWFGLSFRMTQGYKDLMEKIKAESNSKDEAEVFRDSLSVYALMLEQQPWNPIIIRVLDYKRKITKSEISLVVDNTKKDEP